MVFVRAPMNVLGCTLSYTANSLASHFSSSPPLLQPTDCLGYCASESTVRVALWPVSSCHLHCHPPSDFASRSYASSHPPMRRQLLLLLLRKCQSHPESTCPAPPASVLGIQPTHAPSATQLRTAVERVAWARDKDSMGNHRHHPLTILMRCSFARLAIPREPKISSYAPYDRLRHQRLRWAAEWQACTWPETQAGHQHQHHHWPTTTPLSRLINRQSVWFVGGGFRLISER